jgi:hypothetical protein
MLALLSSSLIRLVFCLLRDMSRLLGLRRTDVPLGYPGKDCATFLNQMHQTTPQ